MNARDMSFGFGGFIAGWLLMFFLFMHVADGMRAQAVKHGAGTYVITNPETGSVEFQWGAQKP